MFESEDRADQPFHAVLSLRTNGWPEADLIVGDQSLSVRGPFGELSVPFERITKVVEGPDEGISINIGRLRAALRLRNHAEQVVLKFLLDNRVIEAKRRTKA